MTDRDAIKDAILMKLREVPEPGSGRDVVSLGFVRNVAYCDGAARVGVVLPPGLANTPAQEAIEAGIRRAMESVAGVTSAAVDLVVGVQPEHSPLPGVRNVVAVGAGKGGVGKSTVSVMLAYALKRLGHRTALLDADVYGPSIPKLTGTETAQPQVDASGRLSPPQRGGVPILSMGYMVPPDQAVVWRGPMAQRYVKELLERGAWGEQDFLIVDLPPGTGDIPLTLAQSIPLTGAVVVCTPQDVALLDAVKALRMYQKLGVETLGLVENMSYYICPQCGHRDHIFDHGGCEEAARELGVPFLGGIPLQATIRKLGDAGEPEGYFSGTDGYVSEAIVQVARALLEQVEQFNRRRMPAPRLTIR